jgi:hypothetical protein
MRAVPRQVAVPFLLATAGVVFIVGVASYAVAGLTALLAYLLLILAPVAVWVRAGRRRASRLAAGRTCTCCTGTVHDPVQVV